MAGVYNPGYESTGKVSYITEDGETIQSSGSQYDFISSQDLKVTIPSYGDGIYELKNG